MTQLMDAETGLPLAGDSRLLPVRDFISDDQQEHNPINYLIRQLRGRIKSILLPATLAGLIFGIAAYQMKSPTYETQGLIKISAAKTSILKEEQIGSGSKHFETFVEGELRYLKSHEVAEEVIKTMETDYGQTITMKQLHQIVNVKREKSLINMTAAGEDSANITLILYTMIASYIKLHHEKFKGRRDYREQELLVRESELLKELDIVNQKVLNIGGEYGVPTLLKAHFLKVGQLEELDERMSDLQNQILELKTIGDAIDIDLIETEIKRSILQDHALASMIFDQSQRATVLMRFESRYQDNHPKVISAKAELKAMTDLITERRKQISTLSRTGIGNDGSEQDLPQLEKLLDTLITRKVSLKQEAKNLNEKLIKLEFFTKESNAVRALLDDTRRILDEVRVESRNAVPGVVEIMYGPKVPTEPVKDERRIFALIGAFLGTILIASLLFGRFLLKPILRFEDDLIDVGVRTESLGSMPLNLNTNSDEYAVAIHTLRNKIQLLRAQPVDENRSARCIAVTGCSSSSVVKQTALDIAQSFQQCGLKTLLIDADLVNILEPECSSGGWWDVLIGNSPEFKHSDDLDILPVGSASSASDGQVSLSRIKTAIDKLAEDYNVIVLDTGSYDNHLATEIITSQTDVNILLVDEGSATGYVKKVCHRLSPNSTNPIQIVLSAVAT